MRDDFRVAVFHQAMAASLEFPPPFEMVEQLAVENRMNVPILVENWLLAIGEADDAQAPRTQGKSRSVEVALFVRAAMDDRTSHPTNNFVRHGLLSGELENACDSAHCLMSL
jgi:hypothetical protein